MVFLSLFYNIELSFFKRELLFIYFKLILITIIIFISDDVTIKSMIILLFLFFNLKFRQWDPPYFTKSMNILDLNGAVSLLVIFYSLCLASLVNNDYIHIIVMIIIILTNFQFIFMSCRKIVLYMLYTHTKNSRMRYFSNFINKHFASFFFL